MGMRNTELDVLVTVKDYGALNGRDTKAAGAVIQFVSME